MIQTKKDLTDCLKYEKEVYSQYMFQSTRRYILSRVKREPTRMILSFLKLSRKVDYYHLKMQEKSSVFGKILYLYNICKKNRLGEKLGFEMTTINIKKGLLVYHFNVVINGYSNIGKDCCLHGNNCIGNNGKNNDCPIIGDNVSLGVGAKVIGGIIIANNVKIAAGAIVVHSFLEEGITIGGVPAKRLK